MKGRKRTKGEKKDELENQTYRTVQHSRSNFGKSGSYIDPLMISVTFDTGETKTDILPGIVIIPEGATSFTVKRNFTPIGAVVRIGKWY